MNSLLRAKPNTSYQSQTSGTKPAPAVNRSVSVISYSETSTHSPGKDTQKRWTTGDLPAPPEAVCQISETDPLTKNEYSEVAESFTSCFQTKPDIKQIDRIELSYLEKQYVEKKRQILAAQNSSSVNTERVLWHTTSEESRKLICTNGFNRNLCGKDGIAGYGVYFTKSPDSAFEDTNMYSTIADLKYVFRARVLTGTFIVGTSGNRIVPQRAPGLLYDSTVDDENNPQLFVIYNDTQAYPEYLITYR